MKNYSNSTVTIGFLLTQLVVPVMDYVSAAEIPNDSCVYSFKKEKEENYTKGGAFLIPVALTPLMPLLIVVDIFAIPVSTHSFVYGYKMSNMEDLLREAYVSSGGLLDEFVENVQMINPGKTRDKIIAELLQLDSSKILCLPSYGDKWNPFVAKLMTFSKAVDYVSEHNTMIAENSEKNLPETSVAASESFVAADLAK